MKNRSIINLLFITAFGFSGILLNSCSNSSDNKIIILSRVSGKPEKSDYLTGNSWRYTPQAQIIDVDQDKTQASEKVLTGDFYSAISPDISYDGKFMLFAGMKNQNDIWQIFEMDLGNRKWRQLTSGKENCTDPVYLPAGRFVFSKSVSGDPLRSGHSLFVCSLTGKDLKRITFNPHTYFASNILKDGRVLTIGRKIYPDQGEATLMAMRPDGTKSELFYCGTKGSSITSKGVETDDEKIIFTETIEDANSKQDLISISYNRPLHSKINLTSAIDGDFLAAFPDKQGKLLVIYRKSASDKCGLYEFDTEKKSLGKPIYASGNYDVLDAVIAEKHKRPRNLPSEVDMGVKTGLLLCQDVNSSTIQSDGSTVLLPRSSKIEILGIDSTLGVVDVKNDGSFYLKVIADKPFKIRTLDEKGNVTHGPCDWIWLRPNERRGCVGCHEDPELTPENKVPLAVKEAPVSVPVHIKKIVEKKVSLE